MKHAERIGIIGDGGWGTTLAILLCRKGYPVYLWGPEPAYLKVLERKRKNPKFLPGVSIPKEIVFTSRIGQLACQAEILVLAVPSQYLRQVLGKIKDLPLEDKILLSVIKGIENKTLKRMSEVIREILRPQNFAVLSGPTIAYEVARQIPSTAVVAAQDAQTARKIQDIFMSEHFRLYTNQDVVGVELGGALKNVIAIAAGICDGLGLGSNTKAALLTRGIVEIMRLGVKMGARRETFFGLSGIGDMITTCVNPHSRNHFVGEQLGRGKKLKDILAKMEMVAEGVPTTASAYGLAKKYRVEMPITQEVYAVLYKSEQPKTALRRLMTRQKKSEQLS